jgi:curved DNA-binding protein CbpA
MFGKDPSFNSAPGIQDPYTVLGVHKGKSADEIRSAYRNLAKKLHPDLHPGDKVAEEKFKAITNAYSFLSDEVRRARFDRGEIDANGKERGPSTSSSWTSPQNKGSNKPFEDIFGSGNKSAGNDWFGSKPSGSSDSPEAPIDIFGHTAPKTDSPEFSSSLRPEERAAMERMFNSSKPAPKKEEWGSIFPETNIKKSSPDKNPKTPSAYPGTILDPDYKG